VISERAIPKKWVSAFALVNLTLCTPFSTSSAADSNASIGPPSDQLTEVVVTAEKRSERLEDIPVAVSVVDTSSLLEQGLHNLQDYYATVPGLSVYDVGNGGQVQVAIRGLNTGAAGNPTIAVTVDDVPILPTNSGLVLGSANVPQLDPSLLQQIEILKGPQGTLYGASAMGGVLRYVTSSPSLTATNGNVELDGSAIPGGDRGFGSRGNVNLALIPDTLGLSLGAFGRRDPAFVNDPTHGEENVNSSETYGGHAAVLYQITPELTAHVSALIQRTEGGDSTVDTDDQFRPPNGDLNQSRIPGIGDFLYSIEVYTVDLTFHSAAFDVKSITGYSDLHIIYNEDVTPSLGGYAQYVFGMNNPTIENWGSAFENSGHTGKLTEELRFSSPSNVAFEWLAGGFYTKEDSSPSLSSWSANNFSTGAVVGYFEHQSYPTTYEEYAGFVNGTYHFTTPFSVQVGLRESQNRQTYNLTLYDGYYYQTPTTPVSFDSKDNSFTYLVAPKYRFSDAVMAYARVASGYSPGGPNTTPPSPGVTIPSTFQPSKTVNYELGVKVTALDHRLSLSADYFYVDWSKIQLAGIIDQAFGYIFNGGKAKSDGIEFSAEYKPLKGMTLSATFAYDDAILTTTPGNGFPGASGDPLVGSSKYTGSIGAEQRFTINSTTTGFIGASGAYVSTRYGTWSTYTPANSAATIEYQAPSPAYAYADLRLGVMSNGFTGTLYANNVTDKRGVLSTGPTGSNPSPVGGLWHTAFITPRTIGVSLSKAF
jgi:iron complex outermembrane recepter protein